MYTKLYETLYEDLLEKFSVIENKTPRNCYTSPSIKQIHKRPIRDTIHSGRKSLLPSRNVNSSINNLESD